MGSTYMSTEQGSQLGSSVHVKVYDRHTVLLLCRFCISREVGVVMFLRSWFFDQFSSGF